MNRKLTLAVLLCAFQTIAQGAPVEYTAILSGPAEVPPNSSPGTGFADVILDPATHLMSVHIEFSDLISTTIASHIHTPTALPLTGTAGVATTVPTFPNFPLGVTSGTYDQTFDLTSLSSYNPAFVTANGGVAAQAEAALLSGLADEKAYLNIHTSRFPAGEIRGFLIAAAPDGGATGTLLVLGLAGVIALRRRS